MSRRAARIAAVEVLYASDVRGEDAATLLAEQDNVDAYAKHLTEEIGARKDEFDTIIAAHSVGWRPDRMSPVDRNVLRVGVLELLEKDVPPAAVMDEAVEIAKLFSGEEAGRFVNGVLAGIAAALQGNGGGSSLDGSGAGSGGTGNSG
jgi:transcription antitermination protein NusB